MTSYWLPLPESEDLYVHFGIGFADLVRLQKTGLSANDEG